MILTKVDGFPVLLNGREVAPRVYRFNVKKRKKNKTGLENLPYSKLKPRHKEALALYVESGCDPKKKREIGKTVGYHPASAKRAMDKLTKRKKIVKLLEKKAPDTKIANELTRIAFNSEHPLSKENKPDNTNRMSALKEINRIKDNYPPKQININEQAAVFHFTPGDHQAYREYSALRKGEIIEGEEVQD